MFAELTVVFFGVLIALAAESWWQKQSDRDRAEEYVESLEADMANALVQLDTAIAQTTRFLDVEVGNLNLLWSDSPISDSLSRVGAFRMAGSSVPTGTLNTLISTGDVHLLGRQTLRETLIRESAALDESQRLFDDYGLKAMDNTTAFAVTHERLRVQHGFSPGGVPTAIARTSPEAIASVLTHIEVLRNRRGILRNMRRSVAEILAALDSSRQD